MCNSGYQSLQQDMKPPVFPVCFHLDQLWIFILQPLPFPRRKNTSLITPTPCGRKTSPLRESGIFHIYDLSLAPRLKMTYKPHIHPSIVGVEMDDQHLKTLMQLQVCGFHSFKKQTFFKRTDPPKKCCCDIVQLESSLSTVPSGSLFCTIGSKEYTKMVQQVSQELQVPRPQER